MSLPDAPPKTFISYAWTSEDHKAWVRSLAERLRDDGIDATLDQWDLKPGHDAIAFMEQIVTDTQVKKVIIICDRAYVSKSNSRKGGVGTEAQIISPEIYAKADQDKFVVVSVERDDVGEPCRPAFYKSRIAIPMDEETEFEVRYEELIRWIFDRPLRPKPTLGKPPAALFEESNDRAKTSSLAESRVRAARQGRTAHGDQSSQFLEAAANELHSYAPITSKKEVAFDDEVVEAINNLLPLSNHLSEVFKADLHSHAGVERFDIYLRFLEKAANLTESGENWFAPTTWSLDHQCFFAEEIFCRLCAIALSQGRFDVFLRLTNSRYVSSVGHREGHQSKSFSIFSLHTESLDARAQRLNVGDPRARLLEERCSAGPLSFEEFMQADFCLYLISMFKHKSLMSSERWWPHSLILSRSRYRPFDLFVRAEAGPEAVKLARALGVDTPDILKQRLMEIINNSDAVPKWSYHRLKVSQLSNAENIAAFP